jgi:hypothetical protein
MPITLAQQIVRGALAVQFIVERGYELDNQVWGHKPGLEALQDDFLHAAPSAAAGSRARQAVLADRGHQTPALTAMYQTGQQMLRTSLLPKLALALLRGPG